MADMERMQVITSNIDDIRNLTNCKICLKPYYEPYILACGHTYCYSCLRSWFGGLDQRRKKKNCPDCRAEVVTQPAPNYLLRDLVHIFIGRAELLPEDESLEEHSRGKHDEAKQLSNDRKAGGLFQGIFPPRVAPPLRPGPIRDLEDNVFRCPLCAFELEEGECNNCGWYPQFPDTDSYPSDGSVDGLFSDEGQSVDEEIPRHPQFFGPLSESDDSDSEANHYDAPHEYGVDLDHYDEEDDFIDNGEAEEDLPDEVDYDENGEAHTDYSSDDDGDVSLVLRRFDDMTGLPAEAASVSNQSDNGTIYDESESEAASPLSSIAATTATRPTARRGRQAVVISDDEEEDDDNAEDDDDPDQSSLPARRNRRLISDDEDSLDSDSNMSAEEQSESDEDNSEDSEDTAIPPTTRAERQQRLVNHRSRRPAAGRAVDVVRQVSNSASDSETQRRVMAARQHMAHTMASGRRPPARTSTYVH